MATSVKSSIGWGVAAFALSFTLNPVLGAMTTNATPVVAPINQQAFEKSQYDTVMSRNNCTLRTPGPGVFPDRALVFHTTAPTGYEVVPFAQGWQAYTSHSPTLTLVAPCYPGAHLQ